MASLRDTAPFAGFAQLRLSGRLASLIDPGVIYEEVLLLGQERSEEAGSISQRDGKSLCPESSDSFDFRDTLD